MPTSPITNEVMKQLPSALRPNPYNIDDEILRLVDTGWQPHQIVEYVIRDGGRQPSHVVTTIRSMVHLPAPTDATNNDHMNLGPCTNGCDHGWFNPPDSNRTIPCPSCRPDTTRRLALREQARGRGAPVHHLGPTMTDNTQPTPHTWPVTHE